MSNSIPVLLRPFTKLLQEIPPFALERHPPCIYFLVDGDEVVYVGESLDLLTRVSLHLRRSNVTCKGSSPSTYRKKFNRVFFLPVRDYGVGSKSKDARVLRMSEERVFIALCKAKYNLEFVQHGGFPDIIHSKLEVLNRYSNNGDSS